MTGFVERLDVREVKGGSKGFGLSIWKARNAVELELEIRFGEE